MNKEHVDEIITEYFPKIYGFAMSKAFYYEEAEELCSDIVEEAYISLLKSPEIYNISGYIWRISKYVYSRYVSSKKKHLGVSIEGLDIPVEDELQDGESEENILRLRREIAFLTKTRRDIVYSFYYEDKTIAAISKELGLPEGTVKWHLSKAKNELKEGFNMERKIGKLGLKPIRPNSIGHNGTPGNNGGPEYYLEDKINLNIVYSVYYSPKTKAEIAEELGVTPVFIEDKVELLENNGFIVRQAGDKYTTYVKFSPATYSFELWEDTMKKKLEAASIIAKEYVPLVRKAVADFNNIYIPDGNRELFEAAVCFYGICSKSGNPIKKDLSPYIIRTTDGGKYIAFVNIPGKLTDPEYKKTLELPDYWACGNMTRWSDKYPVSSWAMDTRYCSREGAWQNNLTSDYEDLYEVMTGKIKNDVTNAAKFRRLLKRQFITGENKVGIMVIGETMNDFISKIPSLPDELTRKFADYALGCASALADSYPPQMRDLVISDNANLIDNTVALMTMDILYGDGTFAPLTENEKITSNLIMFADTLPQS